VSVADAVTNQNRRSLGSDFRSVWLSVVVSSAGDGMFITALPLLAATLTLDPLLIAGITIAQRLPWLVLSMFTGAIADRMDRRRLMIAADVARFVIVGVLGVAIVMDVANIWMLYACAFLLGVGETLHVNAAQALVPAIVSPADLLQANARFGSAQIASAQFIGPPLGVIAFNVGASLPFIGDAVSFAGSAVLVRSLPDEHAVPTPTSRIRDDIVEGLTFMWHNLAIRRITIILAAVNFFYFAATSLLVLYNRQQLDGGDATYTAMFVGAATGTVSTRFFVSRLTEWLGTVHTMAVAVWLWASSIAGLAITDVAWLAVGMYFLLGTGTGLWWAVNTTARQRITPPRLLGRQNAAYRTVSWGVVPFGAAFGGLAARWWGLRAPFVIGGVVMVLIALSAPRFLRPVEEALENAS
jgi:MFS family permease